MIKAKVDNSIIDIIDIRNLNKITPEDIGHVGVIIDGHILKVRNKTDTRTGICRRGDLYSRIIQNESDYNDYKVQAENIINFDEAKNLREILIKQNKLREHENSIFVSATGNIFIPLNKEDDTKEMLALKEAVRNKHIDLNAYADRFGNNFNNDTRIFNKSSITLEKIKTICDNLDIEVAITYRDKNNGNVPNPIGKSITTIVTNPINTYTDESIED